MRTSQLKRNDKLSSPNTRGITFSIVSGEDNYRLSVIDSKHLHIDPKNVSERYNSIKEIWDSDDQWHEYTREVITGYITGFFKKMQNGSSLQILNAGSGGNDYGIIYPQMHVDIAETRLKCVSNKVISSIESIPLEKEQFDICLCVGSVINYTDAANSIRELGRLLKPFGYLILEFEQSRCFEYLFKAAFNRGVVLVETFYQGVPERLWAYSERYINQILAANSFTILDRKRFHILSALAYRVSRDSNTASSFAHLDPLARLLPYLRTVSSNTILTCQRMP